MEAWKLSMLALRGLRSKCWFCLRVFLQKEKNERFHVKYKFMILWSILILWFYDLWMVFMFNLQFSFFQRLEVDVN